MNGFPLVSIVIPTYNEQTDVRMTLDAVLGLDYPRKEIIVVDDSTDETAEMIKEYQKYGVRLICRNERSNGCCGARNLGIHEAKGEIVVLLNADVRPNRDFLKRILVHYDRGADYVLVWQKVSNDEYLFARFIQAQGDLNYSGHDEIEWTEGFSCRRKAAIDIGMIPGDFPLPFCRDWLLGEKLGEKYNKVIDRSIIVSHVAPHTLPDFWRTRKDRGRFAFLFNFFIGTISMRRLWINREPFEKIVKRYSLSILIVRSFFKMMRCFFEIFLILPVLWKSINMSAHSSRRKKDIIPFFWAYIIESLAFMIGEWCAYFEVRGYKYEQRK